MLDYFAKDIGIDLGTANSLVYVKGRGIIINEPTLAAVNNKTGQVLAMGEEAKRMVGRTPAHITVARPLVNGVISDFEMAEEMLRQFLKRLKDGWLLSHFRVVVGVPTNLTEVERKSVEDAVISAGAAKCFLIEEPVAGALGARLPIEEPTASMIVDIGGGTTEIAILSMAGIVTSKSLKVAGDKLNEDIIRFVRDEFKLGIGEPTAEELKIRIGSAMPIEERLDLVVRGRDITSGLPREIVIRGTQIRTAISRSLQEIVEAIKSTIEMAPPELVGDILKQGICLCGGGSLLRGVDNLIEKEVAVKTFIAEEPLTCVARGAGRATEDINGHLQFFVSGVKPMDIAL